ncbi:hypothetical protein J6590_092501 [Homalodisca vitripennis]|nr:hypothetical protein J6590_092501 [Homalodisca vitripennis]
MDTLLRELENVAVIKAAFPFAPAIKTLQLSGVGGSLQSICGSLAPGIQMPLTLVFAVERRAKCQTRLSLAIPITLHRRWCFLFSLSVMRG